MAFPPGPEAPLAVAVVAPTGRDAALVETILSETDSPALIVADAAALAAALRRDDLGAVILTLEALRLPDLSASLRALDGQPDWSEVPFILFADQRWNTREYLQALRHLGIDRGLTVLERPVRPVAFRSIVDLAVQSRRQQFRVRDLLRRVSEFNAVLQGRVEQQTAQLRDRAEQVHSLALSLARAENRERERIAQILHDDLQQVLYGIKIHVGLLAANVDMGLADRVESYVDEAIAQTRFLARELSPGTLDGDGVGASIRGAAEFAEKRYGLAVHLDVIEPVDPPPDDVMLLVTRSLRELLLNTVKHADTSEAWVRAWCDAEGCHLRVRDAGRGMDPETATRGFGLDDLRRRVELVGGTVAVASSPSVGTTVTVDIPLQVA